MQEKNKNELSIICIIMIFLLSVLKIIMIRQIMLWGNILRENSKHI